MRATTPSLSRRGRLRTVDTSTGHVTCANVGDAGALLVTPTSHLWLTTSHRLQDNAAERVGLHEHVHAAPGGGPPRLYPGGLACSRSVGDADCPHITCAPAMCTATLGADDTLVIATDGVWDAASTRRVARLARDTRCATSILRGAARSYADDASVVVVSWKPRKPPSVGGGLASLFLRSHTSSSSLSSEDDEGGAPPPRKRVGVPLSPQ